MKGLRKVLHKLNEYRLPENCSGQSAALKQLVAHIARQCHQRWTACLKSAWHAEPAVLWRQMNVVHGGGPKSRLWHVLGCNPAVMEPQCLMTEEMSSLARLCSRSRSRSLLLARNGPVAEVDGACGSKPSACTTKPTTLETMASCGCDFPDQALVRACRWEPTPAGEPSAGV